MNSRSFKVLPLAVALAGLVGIVHAEDITSRMRINGFATAGASWVSDDFGGKYLADPRFPDSGIDEHGSLNNDTVLGLQLAYELSDQFNLVGQLVSAGHDGYDTRIEWAYLAYQLNENLRLRAGRFAAPLYMYSESLRVGQAYPWARLPSELYSQASTFSSVDGLDLLYNLPMGDWTLDTQVTLGSSRVNKLDGKAKDWRSLNLSLANGPLTLHAGYSTAKVDLSLGSNPNGTSLEQLSYLFGQFGVDLGLHDSKASFADVGAVYDDGDWFAAAEFGQMRVEKFINDSDAGQVTVGHYFGKWLPYVMFSKINSVKTDECSTQLAPALTNANAQVTQLQTAITAQQAAAGAAAAAAAQATATAANQLAANDLAGYAASIQLAAQKSAEAAGLVNQIALETVGLSQINQAIPYLGGAMGASCAGVEQTSYSAGFRYDATKKVSLKFEVDHVQDFHGTPGLFTTAPGKDDSTDVFTFNVNAAF